MTKPEFKEQISQIIKRIEKLKASVDNDEINADSEIDYNSSERWMEIEKALTKARSTEDGGE